MATHGCDRRFSGYSFRLSKDIKKRPIKFAAFKLLFIALNIILNLVYYLFLGGHDVGYAFYINLVCTGTITFCFWRELKDGFFAGGKLLDMPLAKKMLSYSWPILILGIAGILNQTAGYIIFPYVYKNSDAHTQLGIFGAASKIAMIMFDDYTGLSLCL